jgi:hypothetical protein
LEPPHLPPLGGLLVLLVLLPPTLWLLVGVVVAVALLVVGVLADLGRAHYL